MKDTPFIPSRRAAEARLEAFMPFMGTAYARNRNTDFGPGRAASVSRLSPYIRYRVLGEWELAAAALRAHSFPKAEKFLQEVFWRTYWKGWLERRPVVWTRYKASLQTDLDSVPAAILDPALEGRTGIDCFDAWAQELVETGYLHNHARMWFASIWIFTLTLPWTIGAHFFMQHLLDGDPASNTLSWRWVAGLQTKGKTYRARSDNIAAYTNGRFAHTPDLAAHAPALEEAGDVGPPGPMPETGTLPKGGAHGLLITAEDLARAPLLPAPEATALYMPSESVSTEKQPFVEALMRDRAPAAPMLRKAEDVVDWARTEKISHVATAYIPVGPLADQVGALEERLRHATIEYSAHLRDWDRRSWHYATKGFFSFKKQIPRLVAQLL